MFDFWSSCVHLLRLGFGTPIAVSASHGDGMADFASTLVPHFEEWEMEQERVTPPPAVSVADLSACLYWTKVPGETLCSSLRLRRSRYDVVISLSDGQHRGCNLDLSRLQIMVWAFLRLVLLTFIMACFRVHRRVDTTCTSRMRSTSKL